MKTCSRLHCCLAFLCRAFSKQSPGSARPEVKPPGTLRAFIVRKYVDYITRFDATFERSYPKIYKVYKLFKDGNLQHFSMFLDHLSIIKQWWIPAVLQNCFIYLSPHAVAVATFTAVSLLWHHLIALCIVRFRLPSVTSIQMSLVILIASDFSL